MKKVVIFNGSPRMDGNTATILQMIERGAKEHSAEVKSYSLFKMRAMACQGCFACRIGEGTLVEDQYDVAKKDWCCLIDDELSKALREVKTADAIVIGSPVYFMQVSGMVKNLYDRFFPLIGLDGTPKYGQKKIVTVYTQDNEDPNMFAIYFDYLAAVFPGFGFVNEQRIVCVKANDPESAENNRNLKTHAYSVGQSLAMGD